MTLLRLLNTEITMTEHKYTTEALDTLNRYIDCLQTRNTELLEALRVARAIIDKDIDLNTADYLQISEAIRRASPSEDNDMPSWTSDMSYCESCGNEAEYDSDLILCEGCK